MKPAITSRRPLAVVVLALLLAAPGPAHGQLITKKLERYLYLITIDSKALRGNLIGDPSRREMAVLLPPVYYKEPRKRFPVVYLLHGLGQRKEGHVQTARMFEMFFDTMKAGKLAPMILVAVDGSTAFGGSYYSNSPTIGNFEEYVAVEIVGKVDSLFRTDNSRGGRAIGGFSMGGFGAIKLGMKYGQMFSQVGSLSGSPLAIRYRKQIYKTALLNHKTPASLEELRQNVTFEKNWSLSAAYAKAAAFSPNPSKPPFYLDLPFQRQDTDEDDPVWQRWWDDDPLAAVAASQKILRNMEMIYLDQGDDETTLGTEEFDRELTRYGIGHTHNIFRGDHVDRFPERYLRMLRMFAVKWGY
ncbi:MAG TPA: alpha/beta hydrolase-fold protein [Bacteroidota bacterium]|nr:alpha/beta hydrolase-fold protein [Bacteroidota bacterium]